MNRLPETIARHLPFFYGYVVVAVAMLAQACTSPGQTFAISAFTPFLQESLGLSSSKLAGAYMLGTFLAAFPLSAVGPLSDRFGLKWTTVSVGVGLSLACLVLGSASGFLSLLIGFLLLRCLGQGALTLLSSNLVSMWFHQRLGRINALISLGGAAAFGIVPILLLASIDRFGWRFTYVAMGVFVSLTLVPLTLLLVRNRPEEMGLLPDGVQSPGESKQDCDSEPVANETDEKHGGGSLDPGSSHELRITLQEAIGHRTFWILAIAMGMWAMIGTGIVFYALPIFEQYGISPDRSKLMFSTFSVSMLAAQVGGGVLADRLPMQRLFALGFASLLGGVLVLPTTTSETQVHLFGFLFGTGQGLAIAVSSTMWVRYYGRPNLGKIRGAVWCTTVAGSGCGPFLLGLIQDWTGSFTPGLWVFACLLMPLAPLALWATAPADDLFQTGQDSGRDVRVEMRGEFAGAPESGKAILAIEPIEQDATV